MEGVKIDLRIDEHPQMVVVVGRQLPDVGGVGAFHLTLIDGHIYLTGTLQ